MPPVERTVVVLNYHRVGATDPANPLHRLHTVTVDAFTRQIDYITRRGRVVTLDDVRAWHDLADINFVLTFDDVPSAAREGIDIAVAGGLPVTLSVAGQMTSHGWGVRDKVYCIEALLDPAEVDEFVRVTLPTESLAQGPRDFYHLTKRADLDPTVVTSALIDPLFQRVADRAGELLSHPAYLSWPVVRELDRNPLVTVANHSWSHTNLAALSRDRLAADIHRSHEVFAREIGRPARHFTIPFGRVLQDLATDTVDILHELDYEAILWVAHGANLVRAPYRAQMMHVLRLHTQATMDDFIDQVEGALANRVDSVIRLVPARSHAKPVKLISTSDASRSCRHETTMRQGKDYASDPTFYRYQFTTNPAKGHRPDLYAVECDGRIEATAYNFHTTFRIDGIDVAGVYLSSWRRLPQAHRTAAGMLVRTMTAAEAVVGVYKPSKVAAAALRGWNRVAVWRLTLPVNGGLSAPAPDHHVIVSATFDRVWTVIAERETSAAGFTVVRDASYHDWRHTSYPLATCRYVCVLRDQQATGYAVTLQCGDRVSIADFCARSADDRVQLVGAVAARAGSWGATTIELETSDRVLATRIASVAGAVLEEFTNYYHLNTALLAALGIQPCWTEYRFHETASTGDVLIR